MLESEIARAIKKVIPGSIYEHAKNHLYHPLKRNILKIRPREFLLKHPVSIAGLYPGFLYPKVLSIFLTTKCNLHCFICRRENFQGETLELEDLYKLKRAIKHAQVIDLTGWGEFFTYPKYKEALEYIFALNKRKELIQLITNGSLLSKEKAALLSGHIKSLTISLNAATAETYNRDMKGGDFDKTIKHVREFVSALDEKERAKVCLHLVAHTNNYREIPTLVEIANSLGISKTSVGNYMVNMEEHEPYTLLNVKESYNNIIFESQKKADALGISIFARTFLAGEEAVPECTDPYNVCYIEVNGDLGPCCFCGSYRIGNVYKEGFEEVWFGNEYVKLRKERHLPVCKGCSPYTPLDDPRAHFTGYYKESKEKELILN